MPTNQDSPECLPDQGRGGGSPPRRDCPAARTLPGPVVLCELEGLTHQEAATRLRCPAGTVAIRLKRARERLRDRLTHRGVDPPASLMVPNLGPREFPEPSIDPDRGDGQGLDAAGLASASVVPWRKECK